MVLRKLRINKCYHGRRIAVVLVGALLACLCVETAAAQDRAVRIGNPTLARFPASGDPQNALPRSVWDMHCFDGKIYLGSGDYWNNNGPIDIWICNGSTFVKEYTADDEMIWDYFEFEGKLFIPGNDATEDWSFENLYINDPNRVPNPGWIKLRTLPGGLHCFDVALFKGKLYASITVDESTPYRTLVSDDMGQTWTTFISPAYCSFVVLDDFMFISAFNDAGYSYYRYDGTALETIMPVLDVPFRTDGVNRRAKFQDGVLYATPTRYTLGNTPLYFLPESQMTNGGVATKIAKFSSDTVQDMVVRGTTCYVMTAQEITEDLAYKGRIYSSTDLIHWPLRSEFIVPGIPLSFEIMNDAFYIGLGSRYEESLGWPVAIGPESGSIWATRPRDLDTDEDGLTRTGDQRLGPVYARWAEPV